MKKMGISAIIIFGYTHVSVQYLPGQNELLSNSFPFLEHRGDVEVHTGNTTKQNTTPKILFSVCAWSQKQSLMYFT